MVIEPARRIAVLLALVALLPSCSQPSRAEQRTELCSDLLNLESTVELVTAPSWDMNVGDLRSGLDKLVSTIELLGRSSVLPPAERGVLQAAHTAYWGAIREVSDDASLREVRYQVAVPAGRLGAAYQALVEDLACARRPAGP
jgi:hypothetical protein